MSPLWFAAFVLQCMTSSLVISIGQIISKRSYFIAATIHGVGNASLSLLYTKVSLSGGNLAQLVMIALGLMITAVTLLVFGQQFNQRYNEEIRDICLNKQKFGMTQV